MTNHDLDFLVLGGGSGGFAAAIAACDLGKRVGLLNTGPLGGTCNNRGCIPSKALIRAAEAWWRAGRHLNRPGFFGGSETWKGRSHASAEEVLG